MFELVDPYTSRSGVTLSVSTRAMGRFVLGPTAYTVLWDRFINATGEDQATSLDSASTR